MRISWLTKIQVGCAVLGAGTTVAWHWLNDCSPERKWQRIMFVSSAVSLIAQTWLALKRPEPMADQIDADMRASIELSASEPLGVSLLERQVWGKETNQSYIPWKDYAGIAVRGLCALIGPALCIVATKKQWCLWDDSMPISAFKIVQEIGCGVTALGIIANCYRTHRARLLVIQQESILSSLADRMPPLYFGRLPGRIVNVTAQLPQDAERLPFIAHCIEAFESLLNSQR